MSIRLSLFVAAYGLALTLLTGCGSGVGAPSEAETTPEPTPHQAGAMNDSAPAQEPAKAGAAQVVIDNFAYQPKEITVPVGTKVTWVNRDDVPHTATSTAKPKVFDSGTPDTDKKFEHVFDKPGVYEYYCAVHPKMTGKVIVK